MLAEVSRLGPVLLNVDKLVALVGMHPHGGSVGEVCGAAGVWGGALSPHHPTQQRRYNTHKLHVHQCIKLHLKSAIHDLVHR